MASTLDNIYSRLNGVSAYHPMSSTTFADWSLEAGDIVQVSRDGTSYQSPVSTTKLKWNGKQQITINTDGSKERDAVSKVSAKKYATGGGGSSGLRAQHYWSQVIEDQYGQLRSGIELTGSSASFWVEDRYKQMRSGLDLTSSSASLYVDNRYKQMRAGLDLTSSSASYYVEDRYKQMRAGLDLTSSSASYYVEDRYKQMRAGLDLTSSSASYYVEDRYKQMRAGLDLTSSSASYYVKDSYKQLRAGLDLTSSSASFYVTSMYNQMKAGLDLTSSSAALYVQGRTSRAYIMTRINADGEGEALIEADKVSISGDVTVADSMTIENGSLRVKKNMLIGSSTTNAVSINDGKVNAPQFQVNSGGKLIIVGASSGEHYDIDASTIATMIKSASVSGNVLTLKPFVGSDITFSKATSLSGGWSSGKYVVIAKQNNVEVARHTYDPPMRLNGTTAASNFSAEIYEVTGSSTTMRKRVYGYLIAGGKGSGSYVDVNTQSDGKGSKVARLSVASVFNSVEVDSWSQSGSTVQVKLTNGNTDSTYISGIHTDDWVLMCTKKVVEGGGNFSYVFEATLDTNQFEEGYSYTFYT